MNTENELFGELHEQEENGLFGNEHKRQYEAQQKALCLSTVSGSVGCAYWVTPHLRYAKKQIRIDEQTAKYELRLQQMWQGSDGSQKWEWVEVVE